jgi:hypothetical protein
VHGWRAFHPRACFLQVAAQRLCRSFSFAGDCPDEFDIFKGASRPKKIARSN